MKTYEPERKELTKEIKALEKKGLSICIGHWYKRKHDNKCIKVTGYDNEFVEYTESDNKQDTDFKHFVKRENFNTDFFVKGVKK